MLRDESQGGTREPFFGFLEWMSIWALVGGGSFPLVIQLDGIVRILGIIAYGLVMIASGVLLYRYRRRRRIPR